MAFFAKVPRRGLVDSVTLFIKREFPSSQMKCELEQWRVGSSPVLNIAVWELSETCQAVGPTLKEKKGLKYLRVPQFASFISCPPTIWRSMWPVRPCLCAVDRQFFMLWCSLHLQGIFPSETGASLCPESCIDAGMKFQGGGKKVSRKSF